MLNPLSSMLSLDPKIPKILWINGTKIDVLEFLSKVPQEPLPGHSNYQRKSRTIGPLLFDAWLEPSKMNRITHLRVTNTLPWGTSAPALKVKSDVDQGFLDNQEPYLLEAQAAVSWTSGDWIRSYSALKDESDDRPLDNVLELLLMTKIATDSTDPDALHHTGSGNRCFFEPATCQNTDEPRYMALLFLDTRARKAARRCRNLLDPVTRIPIGLLATQGHPGAQQQIAKMKKVFNSWAPNIYGLTPWDEAHGDITEEHRLYRLTGHPTYLNDMLTLYYSRRELGAYAKKRPEGASPPTLEKKNYLHCGGEPRILGLWIEFLAYMLDAVDSAREASKDEGHPVAFFENVLGDIVDDIEYALESLEIHHAHPGGFLATTSGSVPAAMKDEFGMTLPHLPVYMFPVILWGLHKLRNALYSSYGDLPISLDHVEALIATQTELCRDLFFTETVKVGETVKSSEYRVKTYILRDDPDVYAHQGYQGTALWHVPAIIEELLADDGLTDRREVDVMKIASETLPPELVYLISGALNHGNYWLYADLSHAAPAMGRFDII